MIKGTKITDLENIATSLLTDELLAASDGNTALVPLSAIDQGIQTVNNLHTNLSLLTGNVINTQNSPTINLSFNSTARELSADFTISVNESLLFPQPPLLFVDSMTATNNMHNKTVILSSENALTVTLLPNLSSGLTINFIRGDTGDVTFIGDSNTDLMKFPNSDYDSIAYENGRVTAIKGSGTTWNLKGKLSSKFSGRFILETN